MTRHRPAGRHLPAILALALTLAALPTTAGADPAGGSDAAGPAPVGDGAGSDTTAPVAGDPTSPSPEADDGSTAPPPEPDQSSPPSADDSPVATSSPSTTTPTVSTPPDSAPPVSTPPSSAPPAADESPATTTIPTSSNPQGTGEPSASTTAPTRPAAPAPVTPVADTDGAPDDVTPSPLPAPLPGDVREIAFPVLGPVTYSNDWGACRDGCSRYHEGNDLIGVRMQPLLAAADGTITRIRYENIGTAGAIVTLTDAAGWRYNYFHVNNDRPGSDDGAAGPEWQVPPPLKVGDAVRAGQMIGYMGDSGNSESSVPHLHFEIRRPDGTPVNPYPSLQAAQQRQTCTGIDGTWSTPAPADLPGGFVTVVPLGGDGRWLIGADGRLFAEGAAARVQPMRGIDCPAPETLAELALPAPVLPQPLPPQSPSPDESLEQPLPSPDESLEQPLPSPMPALEPEAPAPITWTVREGQSLWEIVRSTYGATDDGVISALVDTIFQRNRDQLTDPDVLTINMVLRLPPATS